MTEKKLCKDCYYNDNFVNTKRCYWKTEKQRKHIKYFCRQWCDKNKPPVCKNPYLYEPPEPPDYSGWDGAIYFEDIGPCSVG